MKKERKKLPRNRDLSISHFLPPPTNFPQNARKFIFPPLVNKMKPGKWQWIRQFLTLQEIWHSSTNRTDHTLINCARTCINSQFCSLHHTCNIWSCIIMWTILPTVIDILNLINSYTLQDYVKNHLNNKKVCKTQKCLTIRRNDWRVVSASR